MKFSVLRVSGLALAAGAMLALAVVPAAQSQVDASPSYVAVGVATSAGGSMAWFHEPAARRVMVCQATPAAGGGAPAIQCAAARLP